MSRRTRIILIIVVVAIAAYIAYRWWRGRQQPGTADTTGMGSNLNSIAPELVAGSSGPESGLNYTPGTTEVNLTLPNGGPSQTVTGEPEPEPVARPPRKRPPGPPIRPGVLGQGG